MYVVVEDDDLSLWVNERKKESKNDTVCVSMKECGMWAYVRASYVGSEGDFWDVARDA